jgi:hypothetical protein
MSTETPETAREIAELATTTAQAIFDALSHTSPPELINAAEAAMAHATIARLEAAAAAVSTTKIGRARHVANAFACAREVTNQAGIASAIAAPLVAPSSPAVVQCSHVRRRPLSRSDLPGTVCGKARVVVRTNDGQFAVQGRVAVVVAVQGRVLQHSLATRRQGDLGTVARPQI